MSKFLRHEGCPECGSSDALAIYEDGGKHCFAAGCTHHINGGTVEEPKTVNAKPLQMFGVVSNIPQRRI